MSLLIWPKMSQLDQERGYSVIAAGLTCRGPEGGAIQDETQDN